MTLKPAGTYIEDQEFKHLLHLPKGDPLDFPVPTHVEVETARCGATGKVVARGTLSDEVTICSKCAWL